MTRHATRAAAAAGLLALAAAGRAGANDSTAELAAGGLVLTHNAAIQMRSEDLFISAKQVKVHYVFANTSSRDVTVTVAFPMPDITTLGADGDTAIPTQDPQNFLAFTTRVDGAPVTAQVEQRVVKNGVDRTAFLKSLGVPLAPFLQSTNAALDRLPQATKDQLVRMGLAVVDQYDVGHGMETHYDATWTLETKYYWRQTFPAGRTLMIDHQYTPATGESAGATWGSSAVTHDGAYQAQVARYCVDASFLAAARQHIPAGQEFPQMTEQRIDYVLSSGANWAGPIGDFRMVIDKGAPANLVSFCATGVTKLSPTTFEVRHANFTPTGDESILILVPIQP